MAELSFRVDGLPAPQGSKNAFPHRVTGRIVMVESAGERLVAWRQTVVLMAVQAARRWDWVRPDGAVRVSVWFRLPRPKSHFRSGRFAGELKPSAPQWHITKPDADKLLRAVMDALTIADVIPDDSYAVSTQSSKAYVDPMFDQKPGATILIERLT